MSEVKFGSWSVDESPIAVEYSLVAIEEIRQCVAEGFQKLSRGGIEVGGALYGTREGRKIRILAIRPIQCEHARGPAFLLSDNDRAGLAAQLSRDREDPHLDGFVCVGWFISHTRGEIQLSDTDLDIYNEFFSAPWQVTMVVRPGRGSTTRAGFFVREATGNVNIERSYLEFNFPDRFGGILDKPPARPERPAAGAGLRSREETNSRPREETNFREAHLRETFGPRTSYTRPDFGGAVPPPLQREESMPLSAPSFGMATSELPSEPPKRRWLWLAVWGVAVISVVVGGLWYFFTNMPPQPLSLTVLERQGQLQIEWNVAAKPVRTALKGNLALLDGREVKNIELAQQDLAKGKFSYQRLTGDVEVRLTVQGPDGASVQEASRFLGQSPSGPPPQQETKETEGKRQELEAELTRLRGENAAQAQRIQQLERTLRILQNRLDIK